MRIIRRGHNRDFNSFDDFLRGRLSFARDAFDRMLDDFIGSTRLTETALENTWDSFVPRVDISESDDRIHVRADVPGVDPDKINVEVTEDSLIISGILEKTEEEKKENFYRVERRAGEFYRECALPARVDPSSVEARSKDGVLHITLQKQQKENRRKVNIVKE